MREEDFQRLAPYVAVLPSGVPLNVNTASAMVLSSLSDNLSLGAAESLVELRSAPFRNSAAFLAQPAMAGTTLQGTALAVVSQFFQATSEVRLGDRRLALVSLLQREQDGSVRVLARNLGQPRPAGLTARADPNLERWATAAAAPLARSCPEVCSFFAISLPTRKARWMQQALAYAAEELLAENVDELHLAVGETLPDGRQRVVAIRRQLLAGWLEQLRELGLLIVAIHVDADLLPREATQLLFIGERGLLGGEGETRLAFAAVDWPQLATLCPAPWHAQGNVAEPPLALDDYRQLDDPYAFLAAQRRHSTSPRAISRWRSAIPASVTETAVRRRRADPAGAAGLQPGPGLVLPASGRRLRRGQPGAVSRAVPGGHPHRQHARPVR